MNMLFMFSANIRITLSAIKLPTIANPFLFLYLYSLHKVNFAAIIDARQARIRKPCSGLFIDSGLVSYLEAGLCFTKLRSAPAFRYPARETLSIWIHSPKLADLSSILLYFDSSLLPANLHYQS